MSHETGVEKHAKRKKCGADVVPIRAATGGELSSKYTHKRTEFL